MASARCVGDGSILTRTSLSLTNTTTDHAVAAEQISWITCNWYTGGAIRHTTRGTGTGRPRLEPDDPQGSRPVLRGPGLGNEARLPDSPRRSGSRHRYRVRKENRAP